MGGNPYAMGRQGMNYMPPPGMGGPPGGNPFTMGIQGMGKVPPGMGDAMRGGHPMRPGSMPMGGMGFDDHDSMADMEGMAMGNPYAGPMRGRRMRPAFMSPRHRDAGVMGMDAMFRGKGTGINRRGRGGGRQQRQRNSLGSDDIDLGPSRPDSFMPGLVSLHVTVAPCQPLTNINVGGYRDDEDEDYPQRGERSVSPYRNPGRNSRGREQGKYHSHVSPDDEAEL
jgi:hypothetical protein